MSHINSFEFQERQKALKRVLAKEDEALNEEMAGLGFFFLPPDN